LTNAIDARAFRESLLNKVLPSIHHDVDAWRVRQCGLLIDHIVSIITDPDQGLTGETISGATHALDDRVRKWVDEKRADIQTYARTRIVNEACKNTVDLWAAKAVIHRIDARRRELDIQTDKTFDAAGIENRKHNRLAELKASAADHIAAEETRLNEMVAQRLSELCHEAKVKIFDAESDAHSRSLTSAISSAKTPKPSPISARTRSKGKGKKTHILDLNSEPSAADSETPMTTDDEAPGSPALSACEEVSPADPTPKALVFQRPTTPPPTSRPTSTTPTGPPKLTPLQEPASELTMVLAALNGMRSSLSEEISKVNARVDQLILHPTGIVPSSQPYDDFGDFALPTAEDRMDDVPSARYSTAEEESRTEGLYFDLANILHSSGRCAPFTEDDHLLFGDFLSCFLRELKWDLTPTSFTVDQLNHLANVWNARSKEE
jgi:hypothetical protein